MVIRKLLKDDQSMMQKNAPTLSQFKVVNEIENLELEKEKWKSLIEQYSSFDKVYFTHWFFGKMSKEQLGQFIYKIAIEIISRIRPTAAMEDLQ